MFIQKLSNCIEYTVFYVYWVLDLDLFLWLVLTTGKSDDGAKTQDLGWDHRWVTTILCTLLQGKPASFLWPSVRHQRPGEVMGHVSGFHRGQHLDSSCGKWGTLPPEKGGTLRSTQDCSHLSSPDSLWTVAVRDSGPSVVALSHFWRVRRLFSPKIGKCDFDWWCLCAKNIPPHSPLSDLFGRKWICERSQIRNARRKGRETCVILHRRQPSV